ITSLYILFVFFSFTYTALGQTSPPSQYKDASDELVIPTEEQLFKNDPDPVVMSAQIAVRLKKIQQTIPLDYNEHVQKYITYNTDAKRKEHVAKMLGRSKKFFPIFEPILAKYGIPDEMKYLAVVESALNPFAVSRAGASGPWQFMYSTALRYELNISKRVDERRDPYAACEAAAKYLKEMYNFYGSWQLAIASYNCGAGNVNRAIKKAGGSTSFWDIRAYLPAETRAYVPSFIAIVYAMKYAGKYGISPLIVERENTQRVTVRQKITVNDLESLLNIPRQTIIDENPSLLTTFIPPDFTLNLPSSKIFSFNQLQDSLYQKALCELEDQKLIVPSIIRPTNSPKETSGDDVTPVNDNSAGNTVSKNTTTSKSKTKEEWKEIPVITDVKKSPQKNTETAVKKGSENTLKEDDNNYKTIAYKVKKGDNLGNIAGWFHCNVKEIRRWNDLSGNNINVNDELLIYVHKNDLKKFVRFNYLSKNIKDELSGKITTQEEKDVDTKTKEQKAQTPLIDKINPVKILSKKDCFQTHKIKEGETLWSVAQKYDEATVQDLMQWNGFKKTPVLHKGDLIKVKKIACK
ncbi:MAG TPA: transglycosylase SLT domain-containing protein, partial [Chitinophagales bacterium]|nr:transglycosylase SLT domain-containing protein [Chitinophagales bacterium]